MKTLIPRMIGFYLNVLAIFFPRTAGRKGFLLFCRPFRTPVNEKQRDFFNTSEKFNLDLNGVAIQAYRWGNGGKKILFLHGWQSHSYRWKAYIEGLPKNEYTIYAIDAPGHGLSEGNFLSVPVYSELIELLVNKRGSFHTVVAHSLGCFSLLYTLHRLHELPVHNVVLMAPPGEAQDFVSVFRKTLNLSDRMLNVTLDHFIKMYNVTPEYFSASKFAASVNAHALIIHDEEDDEAPYHHTIRLKKALKNSRLISTKGLGHNLKSASMVTEVVDFITEPSREPAGV